MKKVISVFLFLIIILNTFFVFSACNAQEITIKFLDDKVYTKYGDGSYSHYNSLISFENYEKGNEIFKSRACCYARLAITFNNTPKGYDANDVFNLSTVTVDGQEQIFTSRKGNKSNEIEILLWFRYLTDVNQHCIDSIYYTQYDSIINDYIEHKYELNYSFTTQTEKNWVNRFNPDTSFNAIKTNEPNRYSLQFSIQTEIDYDYIIYNVDKCHIDRPSTEYISIATEQLMEKADVYHFETSMDEYWYRINFEIVGFKKDDTTYFINTISFYMDT